MAFNFLNIQLSDDNVPWIPSVHGVFQIWLNIPMTTSTPVSSAIYLMGGISSKIYKVIIFLFKKKMGKSFSNNRNIFNFWIFKFANLSKNLEYIAQPTHCFHVSKYSKRNIQILLSYQLYHVKLFHFVSNFEFKLILSLITRLSYARKCFFEQLT